MNIIEKQNILINNEGLIHKILREMLSTNFSIQSYTYEDYYQTACLIIIEQLDNYDPNRGTIGTFIYNMLPGRLRNLSLKHDKLEKAYSVISSTYEKFNNGSGEDAKITIEDEIIFEDDIDLVDFQIIYNKVKKNMTEGQIKTYELSEKLGPSEASKTLGIYSNQCSRVHMMINFKLLSEYGYSLYYDDLKYIDITTLSVSDKKKLTTWKKFYGNKKDEPIRVALNSLTLYKKIFQQKYNIKYSKRLTA